jgi:hypothetical protein
MNYLHDLKRFAHSVDFVSDEDFAKIWDSAAEYLDRAYSACLVELLVAAWVDDARGLKTFRSHKADEWLKRLKDENGYQGFVSYAYDKNRDLWLVDPEEQRALDQIGPYPMDLWSGKRLDEPVEFVKIGTSRKRSAGIKTEILLPLAANKTQFGLLNVELPVLIKPNDAKKTSLRVLADSLAHLYQLRSVHELRRSSREQAIRDIQFGATKASRRRVFLAYAKDCDQDVLSLIKGVLHRVLAQDDVYDWPSDNKTGNIINSIAKEIHHSEVVCCYVSERSGTRFKDNLNVLVELGMGWALSQEDPAVPAPIIIRENEKLTGKAPFDFDQLRRVVVPRKRDSGSRNGVPELDKDAFVKDFEGVVRTNILLRPKNGDDR